MDYSHCQDYPPVLELDGFIGAKEERRGLREEDELHYHGTR